MNTNIFHSILLLINTIIAALLMFDWTSLGVSESTGNLIAGIVLLISTVAKTLLNASGNPQTGAK